jgi:hypothetical protein
MSPRRHLMRTCAAALLVVVTLVAVGGRADAAAGDPDFVGGDLVAPYTGNSGPQASSNGTDTLVVWTRISGQGGAADIYGRLMKWDTTSLRPTSFRISLRADAEYQPDVAWNGSSWLVVWQSTSGDDHVVRGRRVSADGALLGNELAISTRSVAFQEAPAVTAGPNGQFFVVWSDDRNEDTLLDIYGRRIGSTGGLMDGAGTRLSTDSVATVSDDADPDVGWNGEHYLVAWTANLEFGQVQYPQVDGVAYRPGFVTTPFIGHIGGTGDNGIQGYPATSPSIAVNGKSFLVVYDYTSPVSAGLDIRATRLSGTGAQWSTSELPVSQASGDQRRPEVAFNGYYLAAWQDRRNGANHLWAARIGATGGVTDPGGFRISDLYPTTRLPALTKATSASGTFTLAFEETPDGQGAGIYASGFRPAPK